MTSLIPAVRSMLASTPRRWAALALVDGELLARPPEAGAWSAAQCLRHVVATEAGVFRPRIVAVLEGRDFPAYDPDTAESGRVPAFGHMVEELAALRAASLDELGRLREADLDRGANHAELGRVTMRELLNEWAAHDTMHLVQAERALMQPFIPGSGPWRSYFVDHDVEVTRR